MNKIEKAKIACQKSEIADIDHFVVDNKMVEMHKNTGISAFEQLADVGKLFQIINRWWKFGSVISKTQVTCESAGISVFEHFVGADKTFK